MEEPESFRAQQGRHVKWARGAKEEELREIAFKNVLNPTEIAEKELCFRTGKHWTFTPGFFIACLTMVFAAIAAWPTVHDWIWSPAPRKDVQIEVAPKPQTEEVPSPLLAPSIAASLPPGQSTSSPATTPKVEPRP
jgi:hypothetical protein